MSEAAVTADVNRELESLLPFASSTREVELTHRKACRTHAKQLDNALTEVETLLASVPNHLAWLFYSVMPSDGSLGGHLSFWDIKRANQKRDYFFAAELNRLRSVCARVLDPSFDSHPNFDVLKHFCAKSAHNLMQAMSDKKITGTKHDASGSPACLTRSRNQLPKPAAVNGLPCSVIIIGASRTKPGTVNAAIVGYYQSLAFRSLAPGTQTMRRAILERFRAEHGDKRLGTLPQKFVTHMLSRMGPAAARPAAPLSRWHGAPRRSQFHPRSKREYRRS